MYCGKCGNQIDNDSAFCMYCGAKVEVRIHAEMSNAAEAVNVVEPINMEKTVDTTEPLKAGKGVKKFWPLMIVTVTVVIAVAVGIGIYNTPENSLKRCLDLGNKYLLEEDYKQAVVAFENAIAIDPKCEDAYRGLADVYVEMGDYEAAIDILEDGIDQTDSDELSEYLKEIKEDYARIQEEEAKRAAEVAEQEVDRQESKEVENAETVTVMEYPLSAEATEELEHVLFQFWWGYSENYDCTSGQNGDLLKAMINEVHCYVRSYYPYNTGTASWDSKDPLGRWESYASVSEMQIDWVLKNIFNCPEAEIVAMKASFLSESDDFCYYLDGYYYYSIGGVGGPQTMQIVSIKTNGDKYQVTWSLHSGDNAPAEKFYRAVVSRKIIDGKAYWSLYSQREVSETEAFAN